jgi:hypothetical protein
MSGAFDRARGRAGTVQAMVELTVARLLIALVPLKRWRESLGGAGIPAAASARSLKRAIRIAHRVERAADRLPFSAACLPRAMVVSWTLRRERIGHTFVIAVRPAARRSEPDALHSWVEVDGNKVIGDLPGPWIETLRMGEVTETRD